MFALRDFSFLFSILILIPIWWLLISYRPYFTHLMSEIFTESTIDSSPHEWKGLKITLIQSGGSSFNLQGWSLFWHHALLLPLSPWLCNPKRNLHFALCRFFPHELVLTCWHHSGHRRGGTYNSMQKSVSSNEQSLASPYWFPYVLCSPGKMLPVLTPLYAWLFTALLKVDFGSRSQSRLPTFY